MPSGLNSVKSFRERSEYFFNVSTFFPSQTMATVLIPASLAAVKPATESSTTKQFNGFIPSFLAVNKYISGEGLLKVTSSFVVTTSKYLAMRNTAKTLSTNHQVFEVARAVFIPLSLRLEINFVNPFRSFTRDKCLM